MKKTNNVGARALTQRIRQEILGFFSGEWLAPVGALTTEVVPAASIDMAGSHLTYWQEPIRRYPGHALKGVCLAPTSAELQAAGDDRAAEVLPSAGAGPQLVWCCDDVNKDALVARWRA